MEYSERLNPRKQNAVYCPICGFVQFFDKNVVGETIFPNKNDKCKHCGHQLINTPEPLENFYISNDDFYEEQFLNIQYVLEHFVFNNPEYNRDAHIRQLEDTQEWEIKYQEGVPDKVVEYIQSRILSLPIIDYVPEYTNKLFCCPKCGRLTSSDRDDIDLGYKCDCVRNLPLFSRERKDAKAIRIEELVYNVGVSTPILYLNGKEVLRSQPGESKDPGLLTLSIHRYCWNKYVLNPENDKFNAELFNAFREETEGYFANHGPHSVTIDLREKPKDASVVGRAVAGGAIAGPVGAVVGALSAVDKNNKNRNDKHK